MYLKLKLLDPNIVHHRQELLMNFTSDAHYDTNYMEAGSYVENKQIILSIQFSLSWVVVLQKS